MGKSLNRPAVPIFILVSALALSGCVTERNQSSSKIGPPPLRSIQSVPSCQAQKKFVLLIHTGTGAWTGDQGPVLTEVSAILKVGYQQLLSGEPALDVVQRTVEAFEDSGLFNAGRGGLANSAGVVELDASIMDGRDRRSGAVAAVSRIKNPVAAARAVMEQTEHVFLVGSGAEAFARSKRLSLVDPSYFIKGKKESPASSNVEEPQPKHGTVGAVALDRCGNLAAATSTGGWPGKMPGRVGDSPIIGAGTFAANETCAISATGHGEYFIRWSVAHEISAQMKYQKSSLQDASERVIMGELKAAGGTGGVIAVDAQGHMAWPFNSQAMLRGYVTEEGKAMIGTHERMTLEGR